MVVTALLTLTAQSALAANQEKIDSLMTIYNELGGVNWANSTNWGEGDPCTNNWYGVTCDFDDTHIIRIDLEDNNLIGDISSVDLAYLIDLIVIKLNGNDIRGNIEDLNISNNNRLQVLSLSNNYIYGTVPDMRGTNLVECYLCGGANIIRPSNNRDMDTFVEKKDKTGWSADYGCETPISTSDDDENNPPDDTPTSTEEIDSLMTINSEQGGPDWTRPDSTRKDNWEEGDPFVNSGQKSIVTRIELKRNNLVRNTKNLDSTDLVALTYLELPQHDYPK